MDRLAQPHRRHGHSDGHDLRRPVQARPGAAAPRHGDRGGRKHGDNPWGRAAEGGQGHEHGPAGRRFPRDGRHARRGPHGCSPRLPPRPRVRRPRRQAPRRRSLYPTRGVRRVCGAGPGPRSGRVTRVRGFPLGPRGAPTQERASKRGVDLHAHRMDRIGRGRGAPVVIQRSTEAVRKRVLPLQPPEQRGAGPASVGQFELRPPDGRPVEVDPRHLGVRRKPQAPRAAPCQLERHRIQVDAAPLRPVPLSGIDPR